MSAENASCPVEETTSMKEADWARKALHRIMNNIIVETLAVLLAGAIFIFTSAFDRVFRTKLKRAFIDWIQGVSRDRLNVLRRAQVKHVFKRHYGLKRIKIKLAGGSYWLSVPCVVSGIEKRTRTAKKYLAKIVSDRSVIKHRYMTMLRNLGVLADGASLKFEEYENAREMACFERGNLMTLREHGVRVPDVYGLYRLGGDDYMLVMEFIDGRPLSKVSPDRANIGQVFDTLRTMHDSGMFHGDIKLDNFMLSGERIVVFDSLKIDPGEMSQAIEFDLACAICALAQKAPVITVIEQARKYYSDKEVAGAGSMLDIALSKVDLELPEKKIRELKQALSDYSSPVLAT
ncbi:MAG TPA: RIO1 family regulatory kinase/ATPase [Methanocellaceae archaeon]